MQTPPSAELLEQIRRLAPGALLVDRLRAEAGVYLVGGAVRDLLLGGAPTDLDLVVEGDAEVVVRRLDGRVIKHERFGTWNVAVEGFSYDVARARRERYQRPGALPDVEPSSLGEDLRRRDFSVNALAVAIGGPTAGELIAAPHGLEDLDGRQLRVLHDESFVEDPTRLLRLARYVSRLDFTVEAHTAELVRAARADRVWETVSGSRVGVELRLLACEPDPLKAIGTLNELAIAETVHPRFGVLDQDLELGRRALRLLPPEGRRDRLAVGLAARRVPAGDLWELLDHLAFEAQDREVILTTATGAESLAEALGRATRPSEVAQAAEGLPLEVVALAGALGPERAARAWLSELRHITLNIAGSDLLQAGVEQGPGIGRGLRSALAAKLDGRASTRDEELAEALRDQPASR